MSSNEAGEPSVCAEPLEPEQFSCSICWQLLYEPVVANCGHDFCTPCLHAWRDAQRGSYRPITCPVCRAVLAQRPEDISKLGVCIRLKQTIAHLFPKKVAERKAEVEAAAVAAAAARAPRSPAAVDAPAAPDHVPSSIPLQRMPLWGPSPEQAQPQQQDPASPQQQHQRRGRYLRARRTRPQQQQEAAGAVQYMEVEPRGQAAVLQLGLSGLQHPLPSSIQLQVSVHSTSGGRHMVTTHMMQGGAPGGMASAGGGSGSAFLGPAVGIGSSAAGGSGSGSGVWVAPQVNFCIGWCEPSEPRRSKRVRGASRQPIRIR